MPSHSEKQRKFMGAELARERAGKKTQTGMSEEQLEDFARKPIKKELKYTKNKMYYYDNSGKKHRSSRYNDYENRKRRNTNRVDNLMRDISQAQKKSLSDRINQFVKEQIDDDVQKLPNPFSEAENKAAWEEHCRNNDLDTKTGKPLHTPEFEAELKKAKSKKLEYHSNAPDKLVSYREYVPKQKSSICPECGEHRPYDERVKNGMKCAECAGYGMQKSKKKDDFPPVKIKDFLGYKSNNFIEKEHNKFSINVHGKGTLHYSKDPDGPWQESAHPNLYGSGGKTYQSYLTPQDILTWVQGDYGEAHIVGQNKKLKKSKHGSKFNPETGRSQQERAVESKHKHAAEKTNWSAFLGGRAVERPKSPTPKGYDYPYKSLAKDINDFIEKAKIKPAKQIKEEPVHIWNNDYSAASCGHKVGQHTEIVPSTVGGFNRVTCKDCIRREKENNRWRYPH